MKNDSQQEERLAWRLKEKQILYDERWLHLESRSYQLADGTVIEPYYVTCPNDFTVIVAVTENGSFFDGTLVSAWSGDDYDRASGRGY